MNGRFGRKAFKCACIAFVAHAFARPAYAQFRTLGIYRERLEVPSYEKETDVFREHIEVILPPTYLRVERPKPAVRGYFSWKFTFGYEDVATLVFRADTALTVNDARSILRASKLYLCTNSEQWILDCTTPVRATARLDKNGVVVDITDAAVVARIRAGTPKVLLRQLIEPGGRFRVDETGVRYR